MIYQGYVSYVENDCSTITLIREGCLKIIVDIDHNCLELGSKQKKWIKILGRVVKANIVKHEDNSLEIDKLSFPRGVKLTPEELQEAMDRAEKWFSSIDWE